MARNNINESVPHGRGYLYAAVFFAAIVLVALAVQILSGSGPPVPQFPFNWVAAAYVVAAAASAGFVFVENRFVRWLGGAEVAVVAMIYAALLAVAATLVAPATPGRHLLEKIHALLYDSPHSLPFAACLLMLAVNLSAAIGRRLRRFALSGLGFFILHGGILLVIVAAAAGSAQTERFPIFLSPGAAPESKFRSFHGMRELPAAISLADFEVSIYPPTLELVERTEDGRAKVLRSEKWLQKGLVDKIGGFRIEVLEYAESGDDVVAPTARVRAKRPGDAAFAREGWISCGYGDTWPTVLELGPGVFLSMTQPVPKYFVATVREERGGAFLDHKVEVNRPAEIGGWRLYLENFEGDAGSALWVQFRAVYDPAIPVVYVGFVLIIAGTFWTLWPSLRKSAMSPHFLPARTRRGSDAVDDCEGDCPKRCGGEGVRRQGGPRRGPEGV